MADQTSLEVIPRRPYIDSEPNGYLESDQDFVLNNIEACVWFLERNGGRPLFERGGNPIKES